MLLPLALLDIPAPCRASDSQTCAGVWDLTHNAFLARSAEWAIGKPLAILGLLILAWALRWVAFRLVDRLVRRAEEGVLPSRLNPLRRDAEDGDRPPERTVGSSRRAQRARSLGSLGKSIAGGLIYGIFFVMILAQIGVNIAPIIASAGVVGVAVGFGAQSLVKDFLSGIFLTLEDQYGVGDSIDLGDVSGTVEAIGLRVTRLRDVNGTVWYVRNGEILKVGNQSQNWARTVIDVSVAYSADLARVRQVLRDISHDLWEDPKYEGVIIEEPEVWGVQSMSAEGIVVRVTLKTAPLEQWRVAREMRERVKDRFQTEGIEMPVVQRVLWPGQTNPGATDEGSDKS
ncbi:MAG: mechanosensitive ion channel family protein [Marmoricola sp.]